MVYALFEEHYIHIARVVVYTRLELYLGGIFEWVLGHFV